MKDVEVQIEVRETIVYRRKVTMRDYDYDAWLRTLQTSPQGTAIHIRDQFVDIECDVYDCCNPEVTVFDIVK